MNFKISPRNSSTAFYVAILLTIHAAMLARCAVRLSPTSNEPGHLIAGLCQWRFFRFDVCKVTPPLLHGVAAIPVIVAGYNEDWSGFIDTPGARPESVMGADFIRANAERSDWLFTVARWACIPFSVIGGLFCFLWSRELWRQNSAGFVSLFLWCFDPNVLGHASLITPDITAAAFGLGAGYFFWRWLKINSWTRATTAGLMLGLALMSKLTWIIFLGLWPALWLGWLLAGLPYARSNAAQSATHTDSSSCQRSMIGHAIVSLMQCGAILGFGVLILNLGYCFEGTLTPLREFSFVSNSMAGNTKIGGIGNRFRDSVLGGFPVPLPREYLSGIDLQKRDFEDYPSMSYLRGEWKQGGWWYYYIYGIAVKMPLGTLILFCMALLRVMYHALHRSCPKGQTKDCMILLTPAAVLLLLVSSQTEFNKHVRYVLPAIGFALVFIGASASCFVSKQDDANQQSILDA